MPVLVGPGGARQTVDAARPAWTAAREVGVETHGRLKEEDVRLMLRDEDTFWCAELLLLHTPD